MRGRIVAVEGPSAAGKTTTARRTAARLGAHSLPEAFDRMRPPLPLDFQSSRQLLLLERALLTEEGRRYRSARRTAASGDAVVTDTAFLGPLTYTLGLVALDLAPRRALEALVRQATSMLRQGTWGLPDLLVYLETPPAERRQRAARDPTGHPAALRARHDAVGRIERAFYRTGLGPVAGDRLRFVSGHGAPDRVADRVATIAERSRPVPWPRDEARTVLQLVASFPDRVGRTSSAASRGNR